MNQRPDAVPAPTARVPLLQLAKLPRTQSQPPRVALVRSCLVLTVRAPSLWLRRRFSAPALFLRRCASDRCHPRARGRRRPRPLPLSTNPSPPTRPPHDVVRPRESLTRSPSARRQAPVPCPPGKDFFETIDGHTYKFDSWVKVNGVTMARMFNKKHQPTAEISSYFDVPATAPHLNSAKNALSANWDRHRVRFRIEPKSTQIYSNLLEIYSKSTEVLRRAQRNDKARGFLRGAQQDNADAQALLRKACDVLKNQQGALSSAAFDLGGSVEQPAQQVFPTGASDVCPVCFSPVTPGVKGSSITSCCGRDFHEKCFSKSLLQNGKCPWCRDQRTALVAADDADYQDSDAETFCADCLDGTDGPNNPILVCSGPHATEVGPCKFALHKNCCNRPPANLVGKNCWCPQHWSRASKGDIKLEVVSAPSSARTTANDRAARAAAKAILVPEKKQARASIEPRSFPCRSMPRQPTQPRIRACSCV